MDDVLVVEEVVGYEVDEGLLVDGASGSRVCVWEVISVWVEGNSDVRIVVDPSKGGIVLESVGIGLESVGAIVDESHWSLNLTSAMCTHSILPDTLLISMK